ncbi:MAG: YihY/virulence factor BrkB family protein [Cryobacterium sp.]|nr:YihY/virulence factor BrkB family protein [Oligoflexia bacterium]
MKHQLRTILPILKASLNNWIDDKSTTASAALAYYTIFSAAPLILIALAISGIFFGDEASRGQIFDAVRGLLGDQGAAAIEGLVEASAVKKSGIIATVIGVATLIVGSTTVFGQLQESLNAIWKVQPRPGRAFHTLFRQRLLSFSMILVIAFLLLVSLILSAGLAAAGKFASSRLPGGAVLWQGINFAVSFGFTTFLFAAIYKILPDVKLSWTHVGVGGGITALFFTIGKLLIGLYLGKSAIASTYGAASSAVIILLWTYYSAAVLLFGAEYTHARMEFFSEVAELKPGAERIPSLPPGQNAV